MVLQHGRTWYSLYRPLFFLSDHFEDFSPSEDWGTIVFWFCYGHDWYCIQPQVFYRRFHKPLPFRDLLWSPTRHRKQARELAVKL